LFDIAAAVWREPRASAILLSSLPEAVRGLRVGRRWSAQNALAPVVDRRNAATMAPNPLSSYLDGVIAGPGIWKWRHYMDIYHRHLSKFVGTPVHVVEVGVYSGGSLRMWREYFGTMCRLTGVDIQPECRAYADAATAIYIGDQADRAFWRDFRARVPVVDVLIDDGGHRVEEQMVTVEEILPHLRPGGVYICEDVHGVGNRFMSFAQSLSAELNAFIDDPRPDGLAARTSAFQAAVESVHIYPFAVVIQRRETALDRFEAPQRGTEWRSFPQV
jgi:SAM-dependent methyltransferase